MFMPPNHDHAKDTPCVGKNEALRLETADGVLIKTLTTANNSVLQFLVKKKG
jgi:hypothetical protein